MLSLGRDKRSGRRPVTCHTLRIDSARPPAGLALRAPLRSVQNASVPRRFCYATHLLDAGVSIRLVSQYLGHRSLKPTLVYLHLTEVSESKAREVLDRFPGL